MIKKAYNIYNKVETNYPHTMKIGRFIISGGIATLVNLTILFVLTHIFNVWYLFSSCIAFLLSFFVSFTLQKFWTFKDASRDRFHAQAIIYFLIVVGGLIFNAGSMYTLVTITGLHYLLAQIASGIVVAAANFILYRKFVFKNVNEPIR